MSYDQELEFPIELRHPDGGSLLFTNISAIVDYFFVRGVTHRSKKLFPADFKLFINGREYNWDTSCDPSKADPRAGSFGEQILNATVAHLKYAVDIERAFYDAVNIPHEEIIPGPSSRGKTR